MRKSPLMITALALIAALAVGPVPASAGKGSTKVKVGNNFFSPKKKTVSRGTTVKFKWSGGAPHNVTKTRGPGGDFRSRTTSKSGVNFKKKFKRRGTYKMICTIHPDSMKLKLQVR